MSFFNIDSAAPLPTIARCGACGLYKHCKSPKLPVIGQGRKRILIVSEAPGKEEDASGKLLVGNSSNELEDALKSAKINLRTDCWLTNAVICYPKGPPKDEQIEHCRPNLMRAINELDPVVIILLGGSAVKALIGHTWRGKIEGITRWVGWRIPNRKPNAWVCPTYHPSYLLKQRDPVLFTMFRNHLKKAVALVKERPWDEIPEYRQEVELIKSPVKAARIVRTMTERGGLCAFDYETDRLKPDSPKATIYSCSVCWRGKRTIAFPWHGEAIDAMKEFFKSDVPKIAANLKFEHRWTRAKLGINVRNWAWDTVLSAHHLDNRQSITSIKFQSYVRLGWPLYDNHIAKYLETDGGGNAPNKVHKLALDALLLYNGLDSLLEYHVAIKQMAEAGFTLHKD